MALLKNTGNIETRSGFGAGLVEAADKNANIVALCADLTSSIKMDDFKKKYPQRFFQAGIAEANMMCIAAGMAITGKIPFAGTFAEFATGRVYDQIRQSIAYSNTNVKIAASHAGLTLGEDGATHQTMEDIGLMKLLPNMVVLNPADYNQTKMATIAAVEHYGPVYIRYGRPKVPNFTPLNQPFEIGKAWKVKDGTDVTVFATGHLLWKAIEAVEILANENIDIELINIHTIKPLDVETILISINKTKAVVTAEEHLMNCGLGDSIAQVLIRNCPVPMEYVAVDDKFGESGTPEQLLDKYGLNTEGIVRAVRNVLKRKTLLN